MKNCNSCNLPLKSGIKCNICSLEIHKDCAIKENDTIYCDTCYINKDEKEKKEEQFEIPDTIRRSYIENYKSCPYMFYMLAVKGLEPPFSSFAQLGIDLHNLFELGSKGEIKSAEHMKLLYENIWEKYNDEMFESDTFLYKDKSIEELKIDLYAQMHRAIDTFYEILPTLPKKPFALEEKIEYEINPDLPKISITMDRIDEEDGMLVVHDWKTGRVTTGTKISTDLQMPLYTFLIQEHYGKKVKRFEFHYLSEKKERIFEHNHGNEYICTVGKREYKVDILDAIKEVQSILARIKNREFNIPQQNIKNMYFTCKTCGIRKIGKCEGADNQSWKQYNS